MKTQHPSSITEILNAMATLPMLRRPLFATQVPAGFPSPADDFIDRTLDLNEHLIQNPISTFFVRVSGHSMTGAGIRSGDLLIVDRSVKARHNHVVIAVYNGEITVKRLRLYQNKIELAPEHSDFSVIEIKPDSDFEIWGVVTHVVHSFKPK